MTGRRVIVEADGGSRGNPGPAGYGSVVFDAATHEVLAERFASIGVETNNVAEYSGLIAGLQAAAELGATSVAIRMDSKLVIEQMSGRWQVKHPSMKPLARQASALLAGFDDVTLDWIPREQNKHADRLANRAMDEAAGSSRPAPSRPAPSQPAAEPVQPMLTWSVPEGEPTRFVLVRHGRTAHTVERLYSGQNDQPLDADGEHQAAALAHRLARGPSISAVISSPLPRAAQTAARIAAALGLPVQEQEALQELNFGAWDGLSAAVVRERWPQEYRDWLTTAHGAPPGGESFDQLTKRVRRVRDELIRSYPGQTVVLVSHVTPIKTFLRLALDAPQSVLVRLHLDPASISDVSYFADGSVSVRRFNDTAHLDFPPT